MDGEGNASAGSAHLDVLEKTAERLRNQTCALCDQLGCRTLTCPWFAHTQDHVAKLQAQEIDDFDVVFQSNPNDDDLLDSEHDAQPSRSNPDPGFALNSFQGCPGFSVHTADLKLPLAQFPLQEDEPCKIDYMCRPLYLRLHVVGRALECSTR